MNRKIQIVVFMFFIVVFSGCPVSVLYPETGVDPEVGFYNIHSYFEVYQDIDTGNKYIKYSADGYRFDDILIINGAFHNQWGSSSGTHCPTDAYTISGHFISPTVVEGRIRYGSNCNFGPWQEFSLDLITDVFIYPL